MNEHNEDSSEMTAVERADREAEWAESRAKYLLDREERPTTPTFMKRRSTSVVPMANGWNSSPFRSVQMYGSPVR